MQNTGLRPNNRILIKLLTACTAAVFSITSFAWGEDGHASVGILALEQLSPEARIELVRVLGSLDDQTILEACNWPDKVRETEKWAWSYPLHYINITPGESSYSKSRDCPAHQCATQAIKYYALELGNRQASEEKRRQAFAWVCHLTGDLHQPLHAGFASDRGGNDFEITFDGEPMNLHNFWDRALIMARAGDWQQLNMLVRRLPTREVQGNWSATMVDRWTEESHELVEKRLYPDDPEISQSYQDESWALLQQRIATAASRLANILNTVL